MNLPADNPLKIRKGKKIIWYAVAVVVAIVILIEMELSGMQPGSFLNRMMVFATPLIIGTLGEIYAERSGVLNLGVEGMMAIGAAMGVVGAFATSNPWGGAIVGALSGAIMGLAFVIIVIRFRGSQVPAGFGIFMLGLGLSGIVGISYLAVKVPYTFTTMPIPILSDIPVIGEFLFQHEALVYLTMILTVVMWFVLFRTRIGLNIRTIGNNPAAADAAGVNVFQYRYLCVMLGGALAGLAGATLSLAVTPGWIEGMVAGRGWIVIALTIFALWNPAGAFLGSLLFGGMYALQFNLQGLGFSVYILGMLPYLVTLAALASVYLFSKRLGAPTELGRPYERE